MAVPVLKLNLAPPSNAWRTHHVALSWSALGLGALILAGTLGFTYLSYHQAATSSRRVAAFAQRTKADATDQARIMDQLRSIDVAKELPRWRLAERIITERSLPWSRLTAELERSLVTDVRLRSVQRTRSADRKVQLKLKGEARSRAAEAEFVESLGKNPFFEQVILERESERQGGGVDFDYTLAASSTPPPYKPLPKFGPPPKPGAKAAAAPAKGPVAAPAQPGRPSIAVPARPTPAAPAIPGRAPVQAPADDEEAGPMIRRRGPFSRRPAPATVPQLPVGPPNSSAPATAPGTNPNLPRPDRPRTGPTGDQP